MRQLEDLAAMAVTNRIHGPANEGISRIKRNSILKPLDLILDTLEQNPKEEDRDLVRAAVQEEIFAYLDRIADEGFRPGGRKRDAVARYVNLFFDGVLVRAHSRDLNRLLQRERLLRSAYLTYFRAALAQRTIETIPAAIIQDTDDGQDPGVEENADAK